MSNTSVETGQIVHVRSRQYLVEEVKPFEGHDTLVRLSCLEDDALGEKLEVLWEREVDARSLGINTWEAITQRGFDNPRLFSAYFHTLRWNCVTSTDPKLFQSPYRAGIEVKTYQLEPLRKALLMPRVALFIADDVGLGKTIEAGLIVREMLMRQKVRRIVVSCPPSVVRQWKEEMENRFGLTFVIIDREFFANSRRERGYGINPWTTHTRFIISHALLRDETYTAPLRDWLGEFASQSLLILDEAHNAAPASGAKYAVDSQLTRTVREIAPRFEHKLFLSATPHNGHSNSFAALLEILDPQRFCRGVPVRDRKLLDAVMVRRLKRDLREIGEDFPQREVIPIIIDNLPFDAPQDRVEGNITVPPLPSETVHESCPFTRLLNVFPYCH
jgi:SNF2 family DNA or RNA helicase